MVSSPCQSRIGHSHSKSYLSIWHPCISRPSYWIIISAVYLHPNIAWRTCAASMIKKKRLNLLSSDAANGNTKWLHSGRSAPSEVAHSLVLVTAERRHEPRCQLWEETTRGMYVLSAADSHWSVLKCIQFRLPRPWDEPATVFKELIESTHTLIGWHGR